MDSGARQQLLCAALQCLEAATPLRGLCRRMLSPSTDHDDAGWSVQLHADTVLLRRTVVRKLRDVRAAAAAPSTCDGMGSLMSGFNSFLDHQANAA